MYYILAIVIVILFIFYVEKKTSKDKNIIVNIKKDFSIIKLFGYSITFTFLILFVYYLLQYLGVLKVYVVFNKGIMAIIFSSIISPIIEEYFFRYLPYKFVKDNKFKWFLMLIMTILFTSSHNVNGVEYVLVFISGILLTIIYLNSKNIIYSVFSHILYNSILLFGYFINIQASIKTLLLYGFMLVIGVIILVYDKYKKIG